MFLRPPTSWTDDPAKRGRHDVTDFNFRTEDSQQIKSEFRTVLSILAAPLLCMSVAFPASAQQQKKPNILVIFGDDIGVWNVSAYHRGMMRGSTPNIDRVADEVPSSPTTMRSNPALPDMRPSSQVKVPFEPAC
jgi:hypothetical protein